MANPDHCLEAEPKIDCVVVGSNRKTVITPDMALYERAKQLEMSWDDCKDKWVLRVGELHIVMAALRATVNAIEFFLKKPGLKLIFMDQSPQDKFLKPGT